MKVNVEIDFTEREARNLLGDYFIESPDGTPEYTKNHNDDINLRMLRGFANEKLGEYFKSVILQVNKPDDENSWKLKLD